MTGTQQYFKINDGFADIKSICEALKQALKDDDQNAASISFAKPIRGTSDTKKDTLHCSFMYTQILKEILLTIDFNSKHFNDFLTFCRCEFAGNDRHLRNIDKIQNEYYNRTPIWWYTYESFLYSMINTALRHMDIGIIVKMGFFVRDLHQHIAVLHAEQFNELTSSDTFTVYRGQYLSEEDFIQMKVNTNGLLAFNNFLSASKKRNVSLRFIRPKADKTDSIPVLFVMRIDPSIKRTSFANVTNISANKHEEEILFSMHSVFRIGLTKKLDDNDRIWEVELMLTSENDLELHALAENMREKTRAPTGWHRLGQLMIVLKKHDEAKQLYELLMREANEQTEKAYIWHSLGYIFYGQGNYEEAVKYYQKSIEIRREYFSADHLDLTTSYNGLGKALEYMGKYSEALDYYKKSLEIRTKCLSTADTGLAVCYHNMGGIHEIMGEYLKALEYYEKSLEIRKNILPENHPDLAESYGNIGGVFSSMGKHYKSLEYYRKSLEIARRSLPTECLSLTVSYNNVGLVYHNVKEYSKALEYYERSLEIMKKCLPVHHPDLAGLYHNIGAVYKSMGEYSKAFEYYQKSLETREHILPANHPDLATSYNNIAGLYLSMNEYSKALEYYQKSLEIRRKSLPANHPALATSYNNIGFVYKSMEMYSKALDYFERALDTLRHSLPSDHPDIKETKEHIERVKNKLLLY